MTARFGSLARGLRGEPVPDQDWTAVLALANQHLLTPALWSVLRASPHAATIPVEVRDYLQALHALNGERNAAIRRQILTDTHQLLHPEGGFLVYQFTRTVLPYLVPVFGKIQQDWEPRNILPARLFHCTP